MLRHLGLLATSRASDLALALEQVWAVTASGRTGPQWYVDAPPFVARGAIDRLVGGRGRRWPPPGADLLRPGDRAGFWFVVDAHHQGDERWLALDARVRAPGRITLTTEARALPDGGTRLTQTVGFAPDGVLGAAYLLGDLGLRELVVELVHRHLVADLTT